MPSTSAEAPLHSSDPASYLPHRPPFLFLDRVVTLEPGKCASGIKRVTMETVGYPSLFLLESMAQLAGIAAAQRESDLGFLAAVDKAEFSAGVTNGDTLLITAQVVKSFGPLHLVAGEVAVNGTTVATATLTLAIGRN